MLELKQIKALDELLDQIYEESQDNDRYKAMVSFATKKNEKNEPKFGNTQMRNIETLAYSSNNLSDLKNYIKSQVGKDTKRVWAGQVENTGKCFGQLLLEEINQIEQKARKLNDSLEFRLKVVRGFIHQFVSEYLFKCGVNN